jgi:hypothetical protein
MRAAIWHARRLLLRLDAAVLAGAAALAAALLLHFGYTLPARRQLAAEQAGRQAELVRLAGARAEAAQRGSGEQALLRRYADLPLAQAQSLNTVLERVQLAARARQLNIEQGNYQLLIDRANDIERYNITLPVRCSYPQLRGFIDELLGEVSYLALDNVSVVRANKEAPQVEAQLQLSAYFRTK